MMMGQGDFFLQLPWAGLSLSSTRSQARLALEVWLSCLSFSEPCAIVSEIRRGRIQKVMGQFDFSGRK